LNATPTVKRKRPYEVQGQKSKIQNESQAQIPKIKTATGG
jgi:hypothetical protein